MKEQTILGKLMNILFEKRPVPVTKVISKKKVPLTMEVGKRKIELFCLSCGLEEEGLSKDQKCCPRCGATDIQIYNSKDFLLKRNEEESDFIPFDENKIGNWKSLEK